MITFDLHNAPLENGEAYKIPGFFSAAVTARFHGESVLIMGLKVDGSEYPDIEVIFNPGALNYSALAIITDTNTRISLTLTPSDYLTAEVVNPVAPVVYGTLEATENGEYYPADYDLTAFDHVKVATPVAVLETLNATENGEYTPGEGVDGFSAVTVNVPGDLHPLTQLSGVYLNNGRQVVSGGSTDRVYYVDLGENFTVGEEILILWDTKGTQTNTVQQYNGISDTIPAVGNTLSASGYAGNGSNSAGAFRFAASKRYFAISPLYTNAAWDGKIFWTRALNSVLS